MANRRVSVWKYVKVGSRWKYCKPVYGPNHKIKPHWVLANGKPEQHPEGNFYISYRQGKKKIWPHSLPEVPVCRHEIVEATRIAGCRHESIA